jgi:hypothetical protein
MSVARLCSLKTIRGSEGYAALIPRSSSPYNRVLRVSSPWPWVALKKLSPLFLSSSWFSFFGYYYEDNADSAQAKCDVVDLCYLPLASFKASKYGEPTLLRYHWCNDCEGVFSNLEKRDMATGVACYTIWKCIDHRLRARK